MNNKMSRVFPINKISSSHHDDSEPAPQLNYTSDLNLDDHVLMAMNTIVTVKLVDNTTVVAALHDVLELDDGLLYIEAPYSDKTNKKNENGYLHRDQTSHKWFLIQDDTMKTKVKFEVVDILPISFEKK